VSQRDPLDQWALAELHLLVKEVTEAYESYDVTGATRPVQAFVEELSNWYVRLSRRRFWKGENDDEKLGAYATLYECLTTVARLIAPAVPFLSEALYRNLVVEVDKNAPESVHLSRWPEYDPALINMQAIKDMRVTQRLVSLGRAARESVNIRVRQPLTKAVFVTRDPEEAAAVRKLAALVESELNVKEAGVLEDAGSVVSYALNPLPSLLGKKFGKDFPLVQRTLREGAPADVRRWAAALLDGQNVTVEIEGRAFEVTPEEVEVKQQAAEGFAIAQDSGYLAALDTRLTDELVMEGLAREVVRRVQTMRKQADFNIADTIHIRYAASEQLSRAITRFMDYIRAETLGESLEAGEPGDGFYRQDFSFDGETLSLAVKRAAS
jgi:isoleucyl-tRNA synthetase